MQKYRSLQFLPYFIMIYMLMAFVWWAILLNGKNEQVFLAKKQVLELQQELKHNGTIQIEESAEFEDILSERDRQNRMVFGEVLFFCFALIIGIYLINRAHGREIQAANQQRNFLLSITHELKSPIASVKLALETFLKRKLNHEQINKLSKGALTEANRLNELVNDLLLSAKLETAYTPDIELINIQALSEKICSDFKSQHPQGELTCLFENDLPQLFADRQGIEIIISNLLENSFKYNFSSSKKTRFEVSKKGDFLDIKISDNGSGIKDSDKKKVFEKFYRSGNEETRKAKGTGLGLYIVNEIVKSHGGRIVLKDNQPNGSIFNILLPIRNQPSVKTK